MTPIQTATLRTVSISSRGSCPAAHKALRLRFWFLPQAGTLQNSSNADLAIAWLPALAAEGSGVLPSNTPSTTKTGRSRAGVPGPDVRTHAKEIHNRNDMEQLFVMSEFVPPHGALRSSAAGPIRSIRFPTLRSTLSSGRQPRERHVLNEVSLSRTWRDPPHN
jgi:hypothetical protein